MMRSCWWRRGTVASLSARPGAPASGQDLARPAELPDYHSKNCDMSRMVRRSRPVCSRWSALEAKTGDCTVTSSMDASICARAEAAVASALFLATHQHRRRPAHHHHRPAHQHGRRTAMAHHRRRPTAATPSATTNPAPEAKAPVVTSAPTSAPSRARQSPPPLACMPARTRCHLHCGRRRGLEEDPAGSIRERQNIWSMDTMHPLDRRPI